ncbi:hypothetical protein bpmyx0001_10790 [Bacillus pseudomycoides DSM 12442]|nr:hypothetical protein bpmyx0001_10790 [Bacillus pseudomycoides DSM 12442]
MLRKTEGDLHSLPLFIFPSHGAGKGFDRFYPWRILSST